MTRMRSDRRTLRTAGAALVLDGHSRAAIETLQSLGRAGIAVDVASEGDCLARRSRYCRRWWEQPSGAEPLSVATWLESLHGEHGYSLIVPSTEVSLRALRAVPEGHPLRHAAVLPSDSALDAALNKQLTWNLARKLGIAAPASRVLCGNMSRTEPVAYPVVLKPAMSLVETGGDLVRLTAVIVRSAEQWHRALDRLLPLCAVVEQEFVFGHGVGLECLYENGVCRWYFQHERLHELPLTGGGSTYRRSVRADPKLLEAATRLLDYLRWHGVAMVEFKGTPDTGYYLMEINPRLWGSVALPIDAGVDFPRGLWCLATAQPLTPQPRYREGYYTRHIPADLSWLKENLRADHTDKLQLTAPRARSVLEYGRPLLGKESWDHFDVRDWRVWSAMVKQAASENLQTGRRLAARAVQRVMLRRRHRRLLARLKGSSRRLERVLFVCYGNICRSPLAEHRARAMSARFEVQSSGFHEVTGRPTPDWYQRLAAEFGIDLSNRRSQRITQGQVDWADVIVLADLDNLERFTLMFPSHLDKVTMLGLFLNPPQEEIEDPYGLEIDRARAATKAVLRAVDGLIAAAQASAPLN